MDDKKEIAFKPKDDAFAEPFHALNGAAFSAFDRWIEGAQQERPFDDDRFEPPADNTGRECADVRLDVRKFGHWASVSERCRSLDRLQKTY